MSSEGMGLPLAVQGSTTREVFEAYIDKVLTPALKRGQIVLMDDLPSHKREPGRRLIEERGCELLYLPTRRTSVDRRSLLIDQVFSAPDRGLGVRGAGKLRVRHSM
jgi:hypothetical protein